MALGKVAYVNSSLKFRIVFKLFVAGLFPGANVFIT